MSGISKFTCAVVTPIGPGHKQLYQECENSVIASFNQSPGLFSRVFVIAVNDLNGTYGRSQARNIGVREAIEKHADWVFFLDADDLMAPSSFETASPYLLKYDAIWGRIDSFVQGTKPAPRTDQINDLKSVIDILTADPFFTLQMGHFVRTRVAYRNAFDPLLDAGEDFDYYLRIWSDYQCIKIPYPLFYNRRGCHSTGPRSADGRKWRRAVEERIMHYALLWGLLPANPHPVRAIQA